MNREYTILANNTNAVILSSETDDEICKTVLQVINDLFAEKSFIFKAVGLPQNITEIMNDMSSQIIQYHQGDSNRFFVRRYPECIAMTDSSQIYKILKMCWSNTITETRRIYIFDKRHTADLIEILDQCKYSDNISVKKTWEFVDAFIENVPESTSNAIALIFKEPYRKHLIHFLQTDQSD